MIIMIMCPKCHTMHSLYIPPKLDYDGGEIMCECGNLITFIEKLEII